MTKHRKLITIVVLFIVWLQPSLWWLLLVGV